MAKVVKAKVTKAEQPKRRRLSKGAWGPWEVRSVSTDYHIGFYATSYIEEFKTKKQAEAYIKKHPDLLAPVIVHVVIPPVAY